MLCTAGDLETAGSQVVKVCHVERWCRCIQNCVDRSDAVKRKMCRPRLAIERGRCFSLGTGVLANQSKLWISLLYSFSRIYPTPTNSRGKNTGKETGKHLYCRRPISGGWGGVRMWFQDPTWKGLRGWTYVIHQVSLVSRKRECLNSIFCSNIKAN